MRWPWQRRSRPLAPTAITLAGDLLEHGAPYILPATADEDNRLDFQHQMLYRALGKNFGAPLEKPQEILDVGCGTGRWVIEMALQFPQANVTGIDMTPVNVSSFIQNLAPAPENFVFLKQDILTGIPFGDNWFDYVHQRFLVAALPETAWPRVIQEIVRVTRPRGWIELGEFGRPTDKPESAFLRLWDTWTALSAKRSIDLNIGHAIGERLVAAGVRHVRIQRFNFPIGDHGGRFGHAFGTDLLALGRSLRGGVIATGVATATDYDAIYAQTRDEFASGTGQAFQPVYVAWGQK